ncbi:MAG: aquaporin [Bacteroidota bacterium]
MQKYLVEFIGTFFLLIAVFFAATPFGVGAMLIGVIYAGGHISKAHYNPAVTLAFWLCRKIENKDVLPYLIAQLLAAALAAVIAVQMDKGGTGTQLLATGPAILGEVLGTFALVFVILNVAISKGTEGNQFYGLAIGAIVVGCAYAFGSISGGAFNPAVAFGACLSGVFAWSNIWIYLLTNFVTAAVAAYVFLYVEGEGD